MTPVVPDPCCFLVQHYDVSTFAIRSEGDSTYYRHIAKALDYRPQLTLDDGADLVSELHKNRNVITGVTLN